MLKVVVIKPILLHQKITKHLNKNFMKTYRFFFLMMLMTLVFEGCKKDDDPSPNASLVNSWKEVSYVVSGCTDPTENESTTCTTGCETLVISATTISFYGISLPYTVSGNTISIDFLGDIETVTYVITGTTLVITSQDSQADGNCKYVSTYKKI